MKCVKHGLIVSTMQTKFSSLHSGHYVTSSTRTALRAEGTSSQSWEEQNRHNCILQVSKYFIDFYKTINCLQCSAQQITVQLWLMDRLNMRIKQVVFVNRR